MTAGASTDDGVTALFARLDSEPQRNVEMRLMSGSAALPAAGVTGAYVSCGMGSAAADFPSAVRDRIALVRRGGNTFKDKAKLAEAAGACATIIFNNVPGNFFGTLGDATEENPHPSIPVVSTMFSNTPLSW